MLTKSRFILLSLLFLFSILYGQDKTRFSLQEVQEYAMKNNRDIRNALLEMKTANKQVWEVTANGFPQVEASASYQKLIDIPTQLIPGEFFGLPPGSTVPVQFGKPHNAQFGITASQLIFSGSYFVGVQASRIYLQLTEQALKRTKLEVKATVTNTYYLVLVAKENRNVLNQSLKNVKKTHSDLTEMYKEGFVEETDVKQLQISVNELENNIRSLETQIQITMRLLKLQMGLELDHPIHLTEKLSDLLLSDMDIQSRMEQSFDPHENIGLQTLITREQLAGLSLKKEKTAFLPTLSAFASIQRDAQRDKFNIFDTNEKWYPTTVVGVQLSWPLFNGSAKIIKIQKAQIELKKARLQREKAESGLRLEFEQARNKLDEANDQYKNAIRNRDLAKDVYETNLEKFKEGIATSLELTQVHNQYLKAESGYLQAVSNLLTARTQLDKILETL